jgi:glycosyltransferase involved in cell wall biosynthesis
VLRRRHSGPIRWIDLSIRTVRLLRHSRPEVLFVQNPSLALTMLATALRPVFRYFLVVDAHNEGIRPFDRPYSWVRRLTRWLLRSADVTIVTNEALAADVTAAGGYALTLPDRLPAVPHPDAEPADPVEPADIVVVATFRPDEPIAAIMAAAAMTPTARVAVTGPADRFRETAAPVPPNVRLTGFLPDPSFWRQLASAQVICDLTLKPDCLVCGAYEALAVGKPMVLSDNPPTRELFGPAAELTTADAEDIATAFRRSLAGCDRLEAGALALREAYPRRWQRQADAVRRAIDERLASTSQEAV